LSAYAHKKELKMTIPLNTPIFLQSHTLALLTNTNISSHEGKASRASQVLIEKLDDGSHVIDIGGDLLRGDLLRNGRRNACYFRSKEDSRMIQFDIEENEQEELYFVDRNTGKVLQCDEQDRIACVNEHRLEWEAWRVIPVNKPQRKQFVYWCRYDKLNPAAKATFMTPESSKDVSAPKEKLEDGQQSSQPSSNEAENVVTSGNVAGKTFH